ncbi:aminoacyl-tRNA hydrolase [Corynebacterium sp. p3-SID1194]|uniref:aminoacyl-tRNA hydrolase n=1 Tax=Corynebacterium sp. p3-SID1194 TaxID=2916105 RepID=UPI0021A4C87A|nr:aminoacyl-tRNA hydrolase [Corynebacterium sp. p3-SID1194]MCT1450145.1 aminoacyl-tRNA hydrolase [Corynebacterium sp. p3-SID1194]
MTSDSSPVLIVGLGNPGTIYAQTRHNAGVMVIDELLDRATPMPAQLSVHKKTNTEVAELTAGRLAGSRTILARTRSFMNVSGGPVKALASYYGIKPEHIYVIYDELDLDFGTVKLRLGGGDHGHNGLKSVTKSLGTPNYNRLAVGIGRPPGRQAPADYVLKPFGKQEQAELPITLADAADELITALT